MYIVVITRFQSQSDQNQSDYNAVLLQYIVIIVVVVVVTILNCINVHVYWLHEFGARKTLNLKVTF